MKNILNDKEVVYEAVELAEGFEVFDSYGVLRILYRDWSAHKLYPAIADCPKWALAAVAAQLMEQVDDIADTSEGPLLISDQHGCALVYGSYVNSHAGYCHSGPDWNDRIMNILRAIVESKVLENA